MEVLQTSALPLGYGAAPCVMLGPKGRRPLKLSHIRETVNNSRLGPCEAAWDPVRPLHRARARRMFTS